MKAAATATTAAMPFRRSARLAASRARATIAGTSALCHSSCSTRELSGMTIPWKKGGPRRAGGSRLLLDRFDVDLQVHFVGGRAGHAVGHAEVGALDGRGGDVADALLALHALAGADLLEVEVH